MSWQMLTTGYCCCDWQGRVQTGSFHLTAWPVLLFSCWVTSSAICLGFRYERDAFMYRKSSLPCLTLTVFTFLLYIFKLFKNPTINDCVQIQKVQEGRASLSRAEIFINNNNNNSMPEMNSFLFPISLHPGEWAYPALTATPRPLHCGDEMRKENPCAMPVASTWSCMGWELHICMWQHALNITDFQIQIYRVMIKLLPWDGHFALMKWL